MGRPSRAEREDHPISRLLLFHEDEVVLCLFAGEVAAIRKAAQAAEIPFSRIVSSTRSPQALAIGGER